MKNEKRNKHMTLDDRIEIQECLNKGMTFKAIAQRIGKDQTTVSKEVKLHGKTHVSGFTKTDECCPMLLKAPFVCNGCPKRNHSNCRYPRRLYHAKTAQQESYACHTLGDFELGQAGAIGKSPPAYACHTLRNFDLGQAGAI